MHIVVWCLLQCSFFEQHCVRTDALHAHLKATWETFGPVEYGYAPEISPDLHLNIKRFRRIGFSLPEYVQEWEEVLTVPCAGLWLRLDLC